jgi:hypothetical protein
VKVTLDDDLGTRVTGRVRHDGPTPNVAVRCAVDHEGNLRKDTLHGGERIARKVELSDLATNLNVAGLVVRVTSKVENCSCIYTA